MKLELCAYKGPTNLMGKFTRLWTRSPYSHVELQFTGLDGYAVCFSSIQRIGPRFSALTLNAAHWDIKPIKCDPHQFAEALAFAQALERAGLRYDWRGVIFHEFFGRMRQHDERAVYCSEAIALVLKKAGLFPAQESTLISPGELWELL